MSRYRTLQTEEEQAYISPFTVGHIISQAEKDPRFQASPAAPNPLVIPSYFDYASWDGCIEDMRRSEPVRSQPPERIINRSTVYGPQSTGHASLRYYGVGPY